MSNADNTNKNRKSGILHMRISQELKDELRREALARHVDSSALVCLVLSEWLARNRRKPIELSEDKNDD